MKMRCPHCGVSGTAAESLRGRKLSCPKCKGIFQLPAADYEMPVAGPAAEPEDSAEKVREADAAAERVVKMAVGASKTPRPFEIEDKLLEPDALKQSLTPETSIDPVLVPKAEKLIADEPEADESPAGEPESVDDKPQQEEPESVHHKSQEEEPAAETGSLAADAEESEKQLQAELDAMLAETCSVCGRDTADELTFITNKNLYCPDCAPQEARATSGAIDTDPEAVESPASAAAPVEAAPPARLKKTLPSFSLSDKTFSVGAIFREAWIMTKGIKASIWGGIGMVLLIQFGLAAAVVMLVPAAGAPGGGAIAAWVNLGLQLVGTVVSMAFIAGLMHIGVRRVAGAAFSFKMVFSAFSCLGSVAVAGLLMTLLIVSGLVLLIVPGIYLAVGYALTYPLIVDRGLGPWEAMEASRKAIHGKWWQVFGLFLLMYLVYFISCIPAGLGMIWTIPMFFTLTGVLYRLLLPEEQH